MALDLSTLREALAADPSGIDAMAYMDIVRSGAEAGLVRDVARFRDYRKKRSITSHTYDARQAETIVAVLGDFREDVRQARARTPACNNLTFGQ